MLTIKHIERDGHESVIEAESAEYYQRNADREAAVLAHNVPEWIGPAQYASGRVFVMNDHGCTIATYNLGEDNEATHVDTLLLPPTT